MPRASGGLNARETPSSKTSSSSKPQATPISAGAFSFSLSTTPAAKKRKLDQKHWTPLGSRPLIGHDSPGPSDTRADAQIITPQRISISSLGLTPAAVRDVNQSPAPPDLRPLSSLVDEDSPFRSDREANVKGRLETKIRLTDFSQPPVVHLPRDVLGREDEGIGVSPRKNRILKWAGTGPPPPSVQLGNILSNSTASLTLFYNSLQRVFLHNDARPATPRHSRPPMKTTAPTHIQHLQTAHLHLRAFANACERSHQGVVFRCEIVNKDKSMPRHDLSTTNGSRLFSDPGHDGPADSTIVVVLQPIAKGCPRIGLDAKYVQGRMSEGVDKAWEIGVWSPYSECVVTLGHVDEGEERDGLSDRKTRVIFASRYLIAGSS